MLLSIKSFLKILKKNKSKYLFGLIAAFTVLLLIILSASDLSILDFHYEF